MNFRKSIHLGGALGALALSLSVTPAAAQNASGQTSAEDESQAIIVTGTRRTDRTVADSTVPIDVINAEALQKLAQPLAKNGYGQYLLQLLRH